MDESPKPQFRKRRSVFRSLGVACFVTLCLYFLIFLPRGGKDKQFPSGADIVVAGLPLIEIPKGSFEMGSVTGEPDEAPVRVVEISEAFWMGETEVTQAQWVELMESNPSYFGSNPELPVERVSWDDIQEFIVKLNGNFSDWRESNDPDGRWEGFEFRLPTEVEWEYACRAGTAGPYFFESSELGRYAWYDSNSRNRTHLVRSREANPWGLYDMSGNVLEWCQDWYALHYYRTRSNPDRDPLGPNEGWDRVTRGGSWFYGADLCRSSNRGFAFPDNRNIDIGFRVVLVGASVRSVE